MGTKRNDHPRVSSLPGSREERVELVKQNRWQDVELVIEQIDDPHNLGAILRTAEAIGVGKVHLVYEKTSPPRMKELKNLAAASAVKWLVIEKWFSVEECQKKLKQDGLQVLVTALDPRGKAQFDFDMKKPTAIVVGNERVGVSKFWVEKADGIIAIPMRGFVQSLNVSVAAAVVMYEVVRQRIAST